MRTENFYVPSCSDLAYHGNAEQRLTIPGSPRIDAPDTRIIAGVVNASFNIQTAAEPGSTRYADTPNTDSRTKFGLNIGGRRGVRLAGLTTFIEARLHNVFAGIPTGIDDDNDEESLRMIPSRSASASAAPAVAASLRAVRVRRRTPLVSPQR